ncbi:hypothetical protein CCACVL1_03836 [Corchorus capsularis]|uniref:Uncharacterized protein n=1 Tax=Corchorus capsularis TaxID=210143 RepID=A0A1R3JWZ9_COCAP|nr:hypothetical protein CCACVL1_03836 [Corchorus capsularis]
MGKGGKEETKRIIDPTNLKEETSSKVHMKWMPRALKP